MNILCLGANLRHCATDLYGGVKRLGDRGIGMDTGGGFFEGIGVLSRGYEGGCEEER